MYWLWHLRRKPPMANPPFWAIITSSCVRAGHNVQIHDNFQLFIMHRVKFNQTFFPITKVRLNGRVCSTRKLNVRSSGQLINHINDNHESSYFVVSVQKFAVALKNFIFSILYFFMNNLSSNSCGWCLAVKNFISQTSVN